MGETVGAVTVIQDQSPSTRMKGNLWTWEERQDLIPLVAMVMLHLTDHQGRDLINIRMITMKDLEMENIIESLMTEKNGREESMTEIEGTQGSMIEKEEIQETMTETEGTQGSMIEKEEIQETMTETE